MKTIGAILVILLLTVVNVGAQQSTTIQPQTGGSQVLANAESLKGSAVYNPQGQTLAKVQSVVVNMTNGTIEYVVLESGGNLTIARDHYIPIPYSMFGVTRDGHLTLKADKQTLEQAPHYTRNQQFELNRVYSYWGVSRPESQASTRSQQQTPMGQQHR